MAYILDLVLILIFGLMVFIGYKQGVVKTLIRLVGLIAAVVIAVSFSGTVAESVFDNYFAESIQTEITEKLDTAEIEGGNVVRSGVETVMEWLPAPLLSLLNNQELGTVDAVMDALGWNDNTSIVSTDELATGLIDKLVRPVALVVLRSVAFVVLFLLSVILVLVLANVLDKVVGALPIISNVNNSVGALLGALQGAAIVLVLVAVVQVIATVGNEESLINQSVLDTTILTAPLAEINPLTGFFESVLSVFSAQG